jgi:hypothetical protein
MAELRLNQESLPTLPIPKEYRPMPQSLIKRLLVYSAISVFAIGINNLVYADGSISIRWGQGSDSESQEQVKTQDKKGGPPDHAPAHGYRAKHQYRYYPSRSVYFDTERKLYFYLKGENWEVGASLPTGLKTGLGDYVSFELDTDKPYVYHAEHVNKYPPGQSKEKKSNSIAKKSKKK